MKVACLFLILEMDLPQLLEQEAHLMLLVLLLHILRVSVSYTKQYTEQFHDMCTYKNGVKVYRGEA